ncbi:multiple sugar transport system substrate-binding protein [Anaeroplasma bactoclasticum]|jgi:multiple sugar transport system substrate-binding protein|uniref:Multiple sugar transport system substrate-binding protein n=1 Tax=Anaeroplasma bactoclasticum TaxID=2088 RepID=A0A397S0J0_9MOLU|nr:extracellular solute-binding protein [Anaeroplasma bactoclasticum]RIA78199.1 multiple sugar transport system substrate-binding protein [Anaeroplasma bactoclasticum]
MRKVLLALLGVLSIVGITSCHHVTKHNEFHVPEEFDMNKNYTISFWAKNDSDQRQIDVYKKAISDFNTYYPNITVELRNFTSYPDIYREVLVNLNTNTAPNVCISYPDNVATYLESPNSVIPLDNLLTDAKYGLQGSCVKYKTIGDDGIVKTFLDEGILYDNYYTIPFMRSTEALYINKTYVERLGYTIPDIPTWDWLFEVCQKGVEERKEGKTSITSLVDPSKDFKGMVYKSSDNWFIQYVFQANMPYTNSSGEVFIFNDKTTSFLLDLKSKCKKDYYESFAVSSHYPGDLINVWDAIFGIDSTAGATWIGYDSLQGTSSLGYEEFELELRIIPQLDINNPKMISQGPSICIFNKDDEEEVLASWLFAQFLLTDDVQMAYQKTEGYLPVTNSLLNSKEFKEYLNGTEIYSGAKKAKELLLNNLDNTFITPVFNGSANVRSAAGYLINSVSTKTDSFSTKEGIDKLYARCKTNYLDTSSKMSLGGILIITGISLAWVGIGVYVILQKVLKNKKQMKKS